MITIKDIAREAGVSVTTVSNVIHNKTKKVSQNTIDRINRIIKERNYIPNMGARMLVQHSSRIIGVIASVLTDPDSGYLYTPFVSTMIGAIQEEVQRQGYYMMLYASHSSEEICSMAMQWNVAGIITVGVYIDVCKKLSQSITVPTVFTDTYFDAYEKHVNIGTQDEEGMYQAVKYLVQRGHKRIGYVIDHNHDGKNVGGFRYAGYCRALKEAGLEINPQWIFKAEIGVKSKPERFEEIYQASKSLSALAVCYDYYALDLMGYLLDRGVDIPGDLSVISFDDIEYDAFSRPGLTTMRQNVQEKGALAVTQLLKLIGNQPIETRCIRLPVTLVERKSVRDWTEG